MLEELHAAEAWQKVQSINTIYGYTGFLAVHPQSKQAKLAKERIKLLKSEQDWENARDRDTHDSYKKYIESHPKGQYVAQAQAQIDRLDEAAKERTRQQVERRKREQAAREAKEKAARDAFLKKIPAAVAKGAYVRAHRRNHDPLKSIGVAGEFVIQRILAISRQRSGSRIEPQPKHPLIVEFTKSLGKGEAVTGTVGKLAVSAELALHGHYAAETSDPATDAVRKANPDAWVQLVDPRLHIVSGGFTAAGTFTVGKYSTTFTKGGVMTQSTSKRAFFMTGTRALVGDDVYVFNGKTWSTVSK